MSKHYSYIGRLKSGGAFFFSTKNDCAVERDHSYIVEPTPSELVEIVEQFGQVIDNIMLRRRAAAAASDELILLRGANKAKDELVRSLMADLAEAQRERDRLAGQIKEMWRTNIISLN